MSMKKTGNWQMRFHGPGLRLTRIKSLSMEHLLFLDLDGVLNDHERQSNGYCGIKQSCATQFNRIVNALPDLKIVISSAWRYLILNRNMTIVGFEQMLMTHGLDLFVRGGRIIGHTESDETTDMSNHKYVSDDDKEAHGWEERAFQIKQWMIDNYPEGCKYAVLDDMPLPIEHLFKTDPDVGLTSEIADDIINYFREC